MRLWLLDAKPVKRGSASGARSAHGAEGLSSLLILSMPTSAIEIHSLSKHFGSVQAVDDLSFQVAAGRVTGFLGPNGSGKTITLRTPLGVGRRWAVRDRNHW